MTFAFWALAYGTAVLAAEATPNGTTTDTESIGVLAIAFSLASVPFAFLLASLVSRREDWPIATLAAMGLSLAVGLPLMIVRNPLASVLAGFAAGAVVALDRPLGTTWHNRAIAAAIVSILAVAALSTNVLFLPMAVIGPALPFTAMGIADAMTPRAVWADESDGAAPSERSGEPDVADPSDPSDPGVPGTSWAD